MEVKESSSSEKISFFKLLKTTTVRRGLYAGVGLQVFQQFVGINTVMYYSPTIIQLAGIASNQTALLLSVVTAALNAFGSILSIYFIDKTGRKKLLLYSLSGVVVSLVILTVVFHETSSHSPMVSAIETSHFPNATCPDYTAAMNPAEWDCMRCLKASPACGFCASETGKVICHQSSNNISVHNTILLSDLPYQRENAGCSIPVPPILLTTREASWISHIMWGPTASVVVS